MHRMPTDRDAPPATADEDLRLDRAVERADRLLLASLKQQDRQRRRRRVRLGLAIGAFIMIAALPVVWLLSRRSPTPPPAPPPAAMLMAAAADAAALNREGWQLWQRQDYDGAADRFDRAVKADPKLTAAWNGLGWSRFNGGKPDDAVPAFEHALALDPAYPAALNGIGQIRFAQNKLDEAERYLLKAAPRATAAQWGLTKIYLLKGNWADAKKYGKMIVASTPPGPDQDDAKAMLKAAEAGALPDELRQKIAPPG